jgi:hypothetical protein
MAKDDEKKKAEPEGDCEQPLVSIATVKPKTGETRTNLRGREKWFKARTGKK